MNPIAALISAFVLLLPLTAAEPGCGRVVLPEVSPTPTLPVETWIRLWTDELAARDLYAALESQTRRPVFRNIGRSEVHHRDLIAAYLKSVGVDVPDEPEPGAYADEDIRTAYATLLKEGQQSEQDAFRAGVTFEKQDISELETALATPNLTEPENQVLTALLEASNRHLRAFTRHSGE